MKAGVRAGWLALTLLFVPWSEAWAHAKLMKSEPARRAVLTKAPAIVRLWFNEKLEPAFSSVSVEGADGKIVGQARSRVARDDPKRLELDLPPLAGGEYSVRFEVLSVDGHPVKSGFSFTVRAAPAAP